LIWPQHNFEGTPRVSTIYFIVTTADNQNAFFISSHRTND